MNKLREVFGKFCEGNDFQLNPDSKHTDAVLSGVLKNEKETGSRYCPCQVKTGDFKKDVSLLCPCNFKAQKTWQEKNQCWCGLFMKE
ncbi:MAG: ferredoxin-thioredoxin reductase catalytic domain-containing protein [Candidatus Woesearchaeota archaeon]|jgi:ferredoxin-thioredoxin reductase catalytic subunit|nr:ferredoxin-thioredoxin reductase catalytic domain-containing protein [Candidatus Woesearchaeota archaeon]|tara:strand:+ start:9715 stop:9975 length:261 start_codon:yes stop_codon:yes gene_type:complete